jgi:mercuric ion binding protein
MKSIYLILTLLTSNIYTLEAASTKKVTDTLRVEGNCEMCKERIENVLDTKGITLATWDIKTKTLTVVYNPKKIDLKEISRLCNSVGHDTAISLASDKEYSTLHACCDYRNNPE